MVLTFEELTELNTWIEAFNPNAIERTSYCIKLQRDKDQKLFATIVNKKTDESLTWTWIQAQYSDNEMGIK